MRSISIPQTIGFTTSTTIAGTIHPRLRNERRLRRQHRRPNFSPIQLTSNGTGTGQFPVADQPGTFIGANGNIVGLAVDVADGIVFFESTDNAGTANNALWWVSSTGGAYQTATEVTLPTGVTLNFAGQSSEGGDAAGLTFDPQEEQLYLTNAYNDSAGGQRNRGSIYVLQWNNTAKSVSLVT